MHRRKLVLVLAFLVTLVTSWRTFATYSALRSDLEELLPESAPSVVASKAVRERMPSTRHLGIVIDTGGAKNLAAAERFAADLDGRIARYPASMVSAVRTSSAEERRFLETYALQLIDPADVKRLSLAVEERRDWEVSRAGGMNLLDEAEDPPPRIPLEELAEKYRKIHGASLPVRDRFVSADSETVVLLVQGSPAAMTYEAEQALLSRIAADAKTLGFPHAYAPAMRFGFAGDIATRVQEMDGLKNDLGISGVLVSVLVVLVVLLYFRSWRALPILGIPLLLGTTATFALVALPPLSIRHLNSNTAFLGSIVVGNGINSGIILLARFKEERRQGAAPSDAIVTALADDLAAHAGSRAGGLGRVRIADFYRFPRLQPVRLDRRTGHVGVLGSRHAVDSSAVLDARRQDARAPRAGAGWDARWPRPESAQAPPFAAAGDAGAGGGRDDRDRPTPRRLLRVRLLEAPAQRLVGFGRTLLGQTHGRDTRALPDADVGLGATTRNRPDWSSKGSSG